MKTYVLIFFSLIFLATNAFAEDTYIYNCEPIRGSREDTPTLRLKLVENRAQGRHIVISNPKMKTPYTMAPDRRRRLPGITRERYGDRSSYIIVSQVMFGEGISFWDGRRGGFAETGQETESRKRIDHYNCYKL